MKAPLDVTDSPVDKRKGQEVEDRGGVQPTVQHDGGGFEFEHIARQCGMARQTILREEKKVISNKHGCVSNTIHDRYRAE